MEVGQKYSFSIEGNHPDPHFVVCKIDLDHGKEIVSISFGGLKFINPHSDTGFGETISHAPVEKKALLNDQIKLLESGVELPEYEEGYKTWRQAFEAGDGGYFTIPPEKVVEYIIEIVAQ